MNKMRIHAAPILIILLLSLCFSDTASSFTSQEEYASHVQGVSVCVSTQCHAELAAAAGRFLHQPVAAGKCPECHRAEAYPERYGVTADQRETCTRCHNKTKRTIESSAYVHSPISNGSCTSCHDPHQSAWPFLLRQSYSELCSSCHKITKLFTGMIHKPVRDGNCGLCHDPHASDYKHRLIDAGVNLCFICHENMVSGMAQDHIHAPIIESGCASCHDPHAGKDTLRLKKEADALCFACHEEKRKEVDQYSYKHEPASAGKCVLCHSPHYSEERYLLRSRADELCYHCHEESRAWKTMRFQHGPVVQGNCTSCHNPHGADNAFILRLPFPEKFYAEYTEGIYGLCFLCHKESLVTAEKTTSITRFRNGDTNLHHLHVNQKKGRSCRACHDVHASDQDGRIRDAFPYGKMQIRLEYSKTETGGRCMAGCHRERGYDRAQAVLNKG